MNHELVIEIYEYIKIKMCVLEKSPIDASIELTLQAQKVYNKESGPLMGCDLNQQT